ncbi:hypothetical protein F5Y11DRAFT_282073 [Daldinia sp. FL1419]|nr:hypothetical protein F5Y11DRAFT_282073 [Daldinia sp. FL1419]
MSLGPFTNRAKPTQHYRALDQANCGTYHSSQTFSGLPRAFLTQFSRNPSCLLVRQQLLTAASTHPTLRAFGSFHRFFQSTTSHVPKSIRPSIPSIPLSPHYSFSQPPRQQL